MAAGDSQNLSFPGEQLPRSRVEIRAESLLLQCSSSLARSEVCMDFAMAITSDTGEQLGRRLIRPELNLQTALCQ